MVVGLGRKIKYNKGIRETDGTWYFRVVRMGLRTSEQRPESSKVVVVSGKATLLE